jgi:hypothetical protein
VKKLLFSAVLLVGLAALIAPPVAFAQEEKPFTLHGEVRTRLEYTDNASDFQDSGTNTTPGAGTGQFDDQGNFWPYRVRIAAEGHFTKNITAWIEFQNAGVFGGDIFGPTKTGTFSGLAVGSAVELYQGNITLNKLWSDHFSLTIGRQELVKGNELQLGDLDFYSGLSHDGVVANWDLKKVDITGWYTRPFEGSVFHGDNFLPPDQVVVNANPATTHFWGAYVTWDIHKEMPLELYFMEQRDRAFGPDTPNTVDMVGARFSHNNTTSKGLVWNAEYAKEFGKISDLTPVTVASVFEPGADISGSVAEAMLGWNFKGKKMTHQFFGKFEMASGNKSENAVLDSKDEGFHPFYTDFHNRLGRGDWFQLTGAFPTALGSATVAGTGGGATTLGSGIKAFSVGYQGWTERHGWGAAYWDYSLDQSSEFATGSEDKLGTAIDLWYDFNYSKNLTFEASVSQLSTDNALTGPTGPSDSVMRVYGNARLRF